MYIFCESGSGGLESVESDLLNRDWLNWEVVNQDIVNRYIWSIMTW